jgi:6-methylsalicylate decarboxylase
MLRSMTAVDVHQHLWPDEVLRALEGRSSAPRAVWRNSAWEVRLRGEPSFEIDPSEHDPERRRADLPQTGVERAIVALSSPVGAEAVPAAVDAWSAAGARLPDGLGWWAAVPISASSAEQRGVFADAFANGAAGLCLPAGAFASLARAEAALPLLAEVDRHGVPVFIHPGEAVGDADDPAWWAPAISYVAQMHAAWHAFHVGVRPVLPGLRVIFALLAGLAPLHLERTVGRGASLQAAVDDPRAFYDTSSYGPAAVRDMARAVGTAQLVHGTDHPVLASVPDPVAAALGGDAATLVRRDNAARALGYTWLPQ